MTKQRKTKDVLNHQERYALASWLKAEHEKRGDTFLNQSKARLASQASKARPRAAGKQYIGPHVEWVLKTVLEYKRPDGERQCSQEPTRELKPVPDPRSLKPACDASQLTRQVQDLRGGVEEAWAEIKTQKLRVGNMESAYTSLMEEVQKLKGELLTLQAGRR